MSARASVFGSFLRHRLRSSFGVCLNTPHFGSRRFLEIPPNTDALSPRLNKGFTLLEVVIASGIFTMVLGMAISIMARTSAEGQIISASADVSQAGRTLLSQVRSNITTANGSLKHPRLGGTYSYTNDPPTWPADFLSSISCEVTTPPNPACSCYPLITIHSKDDAGFELLTLNRFYTKPIDSTGELANSLGPHRALFLETANYKERPNTGATGANLSDEDYEQAHLVPFSPAYTLEGTPETRQLSSDAVSVESFTMTGIPQSCPRAFTAIEESQIKSSIDTNRALFFAWPPTTDLTANQEQLRIVNAEMSYPAAGPKPIYYVWKLPLGTATSWAWGGLLGTAKDNAVSETGEADKRVVGRCLSSGVNNTSIGMEIKPTPKGKYTSGVFQENPTPARLKQSIKLTADASPLKVYTGS